MTLLKAYILAYAVSWHRMSFPHAAVSSASECLSKAPFLLFNDWKYQMEAVPGSFRIAAYRDRIVPLPSQFPMPSMYYWLGLFSTPARISFPYSISNPEIFMIN